MAFEPGEYVGFFADDYNTLVAAAADYSELAAALSTGENGWFSVAAGGDYYVLLPGHDENDLLMLLIDAGLETTADFQYFTYLQSTWSVSGFG